MSQMLRYLRLGIGDLGGSGQYSARKEGSHWAWGGLPSPFHYFHIPFLFVDFCPRDIGMEVHTDHLCLTFSAVF